MRFASLQIYARNHNVSIFYDLAAALPFVVAKLVLYWSPSRLDILLKEVGQGVCVLLLAIAVMAHQRKVYAEILSLDKEPPDEEYKYLVSHVATSKLVYMTCWLIFLFAPLSAPLFYQHLVGYSFVLCAAAMYASISAPFPPLFMFDVGLQGAFAVTIMFLNRQQPEIPYVALPVVLFILYTLLIGRKINNTTLELLGIQERLEQSAKIADAANRAKSEFLAMMSHEIRTPMTGVLGMVDFLKETPLRPDQQQGLETISECSKTLLKTLDHVLDMSRIDAGKLEINPVNFDFHGVLMNAFSIMNPYAENKKISLEMSIGNDVPQYAFGDPGRLQEIIINLVGNAIKFTHKGGVAIRASFPGDHFHVEVEDTGIGISEKDIKRLFQKLSQADGSNSRKYGGSGRGLPISQQLVELMGGGIGVASRKDLGSIFWVDIPYAPPVPENRTEHAGQAAADIPPQRILVVEDNEINQSIVTRLLAKKGHSVALAVEGEAALQMVQKNTYDIILMDCSLPGKSGIDVTRQIKQLGKEYADIPVIALTANAMEENLRRCHEAGMVDVVTKPISSNHLYQALARHVSAGTSAAAAPAEPEFPPAPEQLNPKLKETYGEFGPEYTAGLIKRNAAEINKLVEAIARGMKTLDHPLIQRSAHDLQGVAGYIGVEQLQNLAAQIEKSCAERKYASLPALIGRIVNESKAEVAKVESLIQFIR